MLGLKDRVVEGVKGILGIGSWGPLLPKLPEEGREVRPGGRNLSKRGRWGHQNYIIIQWRVTRIVDDQDFVIIMQDKDTVLYYVSTF